MVSRSTADRGTAASSLRRVALIGALVALVAGTVITSSSASADVGGPPLVDNGSFEAPDTSAWQASGGADIARVRRPPSFHGGHALEVTSAGLAGSGVTTAATRETDAGSHVLRLAVKATGSSVGKVVRAVVVDPSSGERSTSAAVHLQPWWQTVGVTADTTGSDLTFAVEEQPSGEVWAAGDRYLVDAVEAAVAEPTVASTSGRQLLVDGDPYTIRGYGYGPTPIGAPGAVPSAAKVLGSWQTNPAQCQSDAQLMRAAGVNTLRIGFQDVYTTDAYRCMDAFHAADVKLLWLVNGPQTWQGSGLPAYQEAFWETLSRTVEAVKDHPATLGYVIGNENSRNAPDQQAGWFQILDELARRTEQVDPHHVTTTSLEHRQFHGYASAWDGVGPSVAPNVDLWGINRYGYPTGWGQDTIDQDPTRPTWVSEFGRKRYLCQRFTPGFGLQIVLDETACSLSNGSGEDIDFQRDWLTMAWTNIADELTEDDPDGAVVGGSIHQWSDQWWFAFPGLQTIVATPATHEVNGHGFNTPPEWFGSAHAMIEDDPGPRVTVGSYDRVATMYTGSTLPLVSGASVDDIGACSAVVRWSTDVPTYARIDYGLDRRIAAGDVIYAENFVADHHRQGTELRTDHEVAVIGLVPGQVYQVHVRSFDPFGAPGTTAPIEFTTPAGACGT